MVTSTLDHRGNASTTGGLPVETGPRPLPWARANRARLGIHGMCSTSAPMLIVTESLQKKVD
jgi:hypothetical protein